MSLFVLSDTHLSLSDNKPMDVFGNRWHNYVEKLDMGWRSIITDDDTVVIPGDISWAMSLEGAKKDLLFLDSLPGTKIIGKGNHDFWWETASKTQAFFDQNGITTIKMLYNNAHKYQGFDICGSRGWFYEEKNAPKDTDYKKIVNREVLRLKISFDAVKDSKNSEKLVFLHFPPVLNNYVCREIVDLLHEYGITRCFYGHIHGVYDIPPVFDFEGISFTIVSADYLNFTPLLVEKSV